MQIRIAKINKQGIEAYQIRDENNKLVYIVKKVHKLFTSKYELLEVDNKTIGEIICSGTKKYKLLENKKFLDELIVVEKTPLIKYQLKQKKWNLKVDITFTEYNLYDENNKKVAYIKFDLPNTKWIANIDDIKNLKLVLMIITSIIYMSQK